MFLGNIFGGNTSLLVALTGDDPRYKTEEYHDFSDSVSVAVDCFCPTNLVELFEMYKIRKNQRFSMALQGEKFLSTLIYSRK